MGGVLSYLATIPAIQTWLTHRVTNYLTSQLKAKVQVESVEIRFFNRLQLDHVLIEDQAHDTLFSADKVLATIPIFQPFQNTFRIGTVELTDANIYLHRAKGNKDFNYQFIADQFASDKVEDTTTKQPPRLSFKNILMHRFNFRVLDEEEEQDFKIAFSDMALEGEKLSLRQHILHLKDLNISNADVVIRNYAPNRDSLPPNPNDTVEAKRDLSKIVVGMINTACWDIQVAHLALGNSHFAYTREHFPLKERGIDFRRIDVKDINIDINNAQIVEDTLYAKVNKLTAKERSGFVIKNLSTNAVIAPNHMLFHQLHAITGESDITNYYAMEYHSFHDFDDYENRVVMTGHFVGATVSINDIDYYAHALKEIDHNIVKLSGDAHGTVNNLKGKGLTIQFGKHSEYTGDISFRDLTTPSTTFISAQVKKIRTNAEDLEGIYPYLNYPKALEKLGVIWFKGNFDGFYKDFVADGEMLSELGRVNSDINFKIKDNIAQYSGNFSTTDFDVGKWLDQDSVGRVTMNVNVKGKGLKLSNLDAYGKGTIKSISVMRYTYKDINFDGTFQRNQFDGFFAVQDNNLDMDFHGTINLGENPPVFQFRSKINKANLLPLHLTAINYRLSTNLSLDLVGDRMDNLNGRFLASNTKAYRDDSLYTLDSLSFYSQNEGDNKVMRLNSDYVDATVKGNYNFRDLPNALTNFFSYYFEPEKRTEMAINPDTIAQNFHFSVNIRNTKNFSQLLVKQLHNIEGGKIDGYFNSAGNEYNLNVNIPGITWRKARFANVKLKTGTGDQMIALTSSIDSVFYNDSLLARPVKFEAGIANDTMRYRFAIQDSTSPNRLDLRGKVVSDFKTLSMNLLPSQLFINGEEWQIKDGNSIKLDKQNLVVSNLQMQKGEHLFKVSTFNPDGHSHLNVEFANINLQEVIPGLRAITGYDIEGTVNGYFSVLDVMHNPSMSSVIKLDSFKIDKDYLGDLQLTGTLIQGDSLINVAGTFKGPDNNIDIFGRINTQSEDNYLDLNYLLYNVHLPHIEKFVSEYVSKVKGDATGNLHMIGTFDRPDFEGNIIGKDVSATVNYLNTTYSFENEEILLKKGDIDLGTMELSDGRGNTAIASGDIVHDRFHNFALNVDVRTDIFQFLNTTSHNNSTFYGPVYAKGLVQFKGPINDLDINASATTMKGTDFAIAVNNTKDVDRYTFYRFLSTDSTKRAKMAPIQINTGGVNLNFDIDVTPEAKVKLIMSSSQGDMIQTRGHGDMKVLYNKSGDFNLIGRYVIDEGQYQFSMQNVISKNFEIERNSEIVWNGDPYDPRLLISALYKLRAAPYDLIEDVLKEDQPKQQSKNRVPVFLQLKLAGTLLTPEINFDINVPDVDQGIRSALDSKLALIRLDQNEFNKQVVGLLVLNRFLPVVPIGSSANSNIAEGATNTVSEFVSNQLSLYLTDWISKFVTEMQLDIKYHNYQNSTSSTTGTSTDKEFDNRRELQLALTKSFFNDRVEVDVGGNFDFGQNSNGNSGVNTTTGAPNSNNVTGDFEIRYNFTPDGRIKVKVFRKGEYDLFQERNLNKTGVGISYRKEFDNAKDFFSGLREKKRKKAAKQQPVPAPSPQPAPQVEPKKEPESAGTR